jgi:DNA-binding NarL/FixJ family response regulator
MIRILLADDHEIVRRGVRQLLEDHPGWQVCGEARTGREAVDLALDLRPQAAVLDLAMPDLNGLEATRQIKRQLPSTEVLVFTMHDSSHLLHEILASGARACILKSDAARQLVAGIETLLAHQPVGATPAATTPAARLLRTTQRPSDGAAPPSALTARQREIVRLIAEGKTSKEVAAALCISAKTVETRRAAIMRKLELRSMVELVRYAIRNQIVTL